MKITLKTLKQQTFFVEVDVEKDTVKTLKEKLYTESELAYPVDRQRLIYLGKIMEDDHLLSQYKLDDKKFIVVMSKKPSPAADEPAEGEATEPKKETAPAPKQADTKVEGDSTDPPSSSASKPSTSTPSQSAPSTADDQKTAAPKDSTTSSTESKPANPSTDAVPEEMQVNIQRLKEMGYSEQSARLALEICANIPDRAVEYLLSEMGGGSDVSFALAAAQQQQQEQQGVPTGAAPAGDANPLDFLRNNPVFENMKRILRDDPLMLPHLMRRMQESNPVLLSIIAEHQDEFLAMINEGSAPMSHDMEDIASAMINSLTPSDMDAIERLKALGYPEHLVIQAYIACERDEYDAAMFLVTQTLDDEE
ncbi:UV excision repair protein RAD23 homolog B-like [Anopheles marshallii]|uniref:UV excision repair protein RAD23 homolog B-like n=1 Tax=Anopheles marshallii TaxID=1521116 RepID=UPI00237A1668|nr:UV excision repair protein RAD23 homolog B-like [Anopheles marshallii]